MRLLALAILLTTTMILTATAATAHAKATVPLGHVEVRGSGPTPMVLIAGPTLDWRYWEGFMDRNGDAYTMYAVTLPGMSGSEAMPMPEPWRPADRAARRDPPLDTPWLDNAAEAIADMMIEREVGPAVIVGHAMGGTLALRFGIEHPQLVSAVVSLEGPVAYPTTRRGTKKKRAAEALLSYRVNLMVMTPEEWTEQMTQWGQASVTDPAIADFLTRLSLDTDREVIIQYLVEDYMTDLTDEIGKLRVPTLGIFTMVTTEQMKAADNVWKKQFAPAWHEDIRFYATDDISFFYNLKQPERFDAEIAGFLKSNNITGAPEQGEGAANDR